jgi:hypothetical protein
MGPGFRRYSLLGGSTGHADRLDFVLHLKRHDADCPGYRAGAGEAFAGRQGQAKDNLEVAKVTKTIVAPARGATASYQAVNRSRSAGCASWES